MLSPTQQLPADILTAWICMHVCRCMYSQSQVAAVEWGKGFKWSQKIQSNKKGVRSLENHYVRTHDFLARWSFILTLLSFSYVGLYKCFTFKRVKAFREVSPKPCNPQRSKFCQKLKLSWVAAQLSCTFQRLKLNLEANRYLSQQKPSRVRWRRRRPRRPTWR